MDDEQSQTDQLLNEQISLNKAETERKRQNLYQTKLDIIKGQGGQIWEPTMAGASKKGGTMGQQG